MKQKKLLSLSLILALFVSMFVMAPAAGAVSGPVNLIYAKPVIEQYSISATGYVEIENLGYNKNVTIHYTTDNGATWEDVSATYMQPTWGNYEAWEFDVPGVGVGLRGNATITFAIKYEVNGQEYWDNNNGQNYTVKAGYGINSAFDFGDSGSVALFNSYRYSDNKIAGSVQLKDMAYEKDVKIRYTTDNWASYEEVYATYGYTLDKDYVQVWDFEFSATENPVEFAISYTVNGQTYWDNNFGQNYTI